MPGEPNYACMSKIILYCMRESETQVFILSVLYELINAITNTLSARTDIAPISIALPWLVTQPSAASCPWRGRWFLSCSSRSSHQSSMTSLFSFYRYIYYWIFFFRVMIFQDPIWSQYKHIHPLDIFLHSYKPRGRILHLHFWRYIENTLLHIKNLIFSN